MELLAHSPLGASGAPRWLKCPGSVGLSHGVHDEEDDTFSAPGTVAHALAAHCLHYDMDAWEFIGWHVGLKTGELFSPPSKLKSIEFLSGGDILTVDKEMADAVQEYLAAVRLLHLDRNQGNTWIERHFHCSGLHEDFYGTSDFVFLDDCTLHVWDYKHGAGIIIEVQDNSQLMYYACGALEDLNLWGTVDKVVLHVAQPRGWHPDGAIRTWAIGIDDLNAWLRKTLIPGMDRALVSRDTVSGEHCRFCPARARMCPQLWEDLDELEKFMEAKKLTGAETARVLTLMIPGMIMRKAALKTATAMLNTGTKVPGWKLAKARSNRVFKDDAEAAAIKEFGKKAAFTAPSLKSPAQMDMMPKGKAFTTRWAYKPDAGLTCIPESDNRAEVSKDTKSVFKAVKKR